MNKKPMQSRQWYPYAVALLIAVVAHVLFSRFVALVTVKKLIGYFMPLIIACVIAYLVNPLAKVYQRSLLAWMKNEKRQKTTSYILAYLTYVVLLLAMLVTIVPQIIQSITTFVSRLDVYAQALSSMLTQLGLSSTTVDTQAVASSSKDLLINLRTYLDQNMEQILTTTLATGSSLGQIGIAAILSVYIMAEKESLNAGFQRLTKALFGKETYQTIMNIIRKCDQILIQYIVYNLIDALIITAITVAFMFLTKMPYVGLVAFVVGVTNLIPTVGPVIGGAVGGFILFLIDPVHAVVFIVFIMILQFCDGNIIKPKLFGDSLGISGFWIMLAVIISGRMFGMIGILISVPVFAMIDYLYNDYLLPYLESRHEDEQEIVETTE